MSSMSIYTASSLEHATPVRCHQHHSEMQTLLLDEEGASKTITDSWILQRMKSVQMNPTMSTEGLLLMKTLKHVVCYWVKERSGISNAST